MAWASEITATQLTNITTEQFFSYGGSTKVTLNPCEECVIQLECNFPGSPTDHLVVSVYATPDDSSEVWDIEPFLTFVLVNTPDPNRLSFVVSGVYAFRVGVKRTGTTDTITSADSSHRKNGVSL